MSLYELRKAIKHFRTTNLRLAEVDALKRALAPILHHYVHPSFIIQPGERIFRAVRWANRPANITHLSYPPPERAGYGRCNRPNRPIFYGSTGSTAAIQELHPAHQTTIALAMWRVTKPIMAVNVGYSEKVFKKLQSNRWSNIWWRKPIANEIPPAAAETPENSLVDRFLAKDFTKSVTSGQEWKYKSSIAISETYLDAQPVDGEVQGEIPGLLRAGETISGTTTAALFYPSIATAANDDNIVIKCATADGSLSFSWVHFLQIISDSSDKKKMSFTGLDFSDIASESGELTWLGHFPNHLAAGTDLQLHFDGTDLLLRDSLGHIAGKFERPS